MKPLRTLVALSALALSSSTAAFADTILLGSYGTTAANPGVANTAVAYSPTLSTVNNGSTSTFNILPASTWLAALPNSSYISFNTGTAPGQSYVAPNGDYIYTSTFFLTAAQAAGVGTISVLADDTVAITLNNQLILAAAGPKGAGNTYVHCSDVVPDCLTVDTGALTGLVAGTNTLTFDVKQVNFANEGLDFAGSIVAVPEPASLALLGTGLLGVVGVLRNRSNK